MKTLDQLLTGAAADLRDVLEADASLNSINQFMRRGATVSPLSGAGANDRRPSRPRLAAVATIAVVVVGAVGLYVVETRPEPPSSVEAGAGAVLADPGPAPLKLPATPSGYLFAGIGLRPLTGNQFASAVFIHRDTDGNVTGKLIARAGGGQVCAALELTSQLIASVSVVVPANLVGATGGRFYAEPQYRHLSLGYVLGDGRYLCFDMFNADESTDAAAEATMQAIAAAIAIGPGNSLAVQTPLPDGWVFAAVGPEPLNIKTFYQGYSTSLADREVQHHLEIDNVYTADDGLHYWLTEESLQPITVRGHQGYVTSHQYVPGENAWGGGVQGGRTDVHTLIWQEIPGTWTIIRGDDMSTEQLLAVADELVPMPQNEWQQLFATPFPPFGGAPQNSVPGNSSNPGS